MTSVNRYYGGADLDSADKDADQDQRLTIGKTTYIVSDRFKSAIRNSYIDWGTFLEVYHDSLNYNLMFDQVKKLIHVDGVTESEIQRELLIPFLKMVYHKSAEAHITGIMQQFISDSPVTAALHKLFTTIKLHFEHIVERFIIARNKFLTVHKYDRIKLNDWDTLLAEWNEINTNYGLETSSIVLLFLNPPKGFKSGIHYRIPTIEDLTDQLKIEVKKFHYPGFCMKEPGVRLTKLLTFPLDSFVSILKKIEPEQQYTDYTKLNEKISQITKTAVTKPHVVDHMKREELPKDLSRKLQSTSASEKHDANVQAVRWYVERILELRRGLVDYGKKYEQYYLEHARIINEIDEEIKALLI